MSKVATLAQPPAARARRTVTSSGALLILERWG
jgi:hypothetical protein